jgi:hypothetical protein
MTTDPLLSVIQTVGLLSPTTPVGWLDAVGDQGSVERGYLRLLFRRGAHRTPGTVIGMYPRRRFGIFFRAGKIRRLDEVS